MIMKTNQYLILPLFIRTNILIWKNIMKYNWCESLCATLFPWAFWSHAKQPSYQYNHDPNKKMGIEKKIWLTDQSLRKSFWCWCAKLIGIIYARAIQAAKFSVLSTLFCWLLHKSLHACSPKIITRTCSSLIQSEIKFSFVAKFTL